MARTSASESDPTPSVADATDPPGFGEATSTPEGSAGRSAIASLEELARTVARTLTFERIELVPVDGGSNASCSEEDRVWRIAVSPSRDNTAPALGLRRRRLSEVLVEGSRRSWRLRVWSAPEAVTAKSEERLLALAPELARLLDAHQPPLPGSSGDAAALLLALHRRLSQGVRSTVIVAETAKGAETALSPAWCRRAHALAHALVDGCESFSIAANGLAVLLEDADAGADSHAALTLAEALRQALDASAALERGTESPHVQAVGVGVVYSGEVVVAVPGDLLELARSAARASHRAGATLLLIGPSRYRALDGRELGEPPQHPQALL